MNWRRWSVGILILGMLVGLSTYSNRKRLFASWLERFEKVQYGSKRDLLAVSFQDSRVEFGPVLVHCKSIEGGSIDVPVEVEHLSATVDPSSLFSDELLVHSLRARGVRLPWLPPERLRWSLPEYPQLPATASLQATGQLHTSGQLSGSSIGDESRGVVDMREWIESRVIDSVQSLDRDSDPHRAAVQEMEDRLRALDARQQDLRQSMPAALCDRQVLAPITKEYHAINQKLAETRIAWRDATKVREKKWAQLESQLSERLDAQVVRMVPDIEPEVRVQAVSYSQRIEESVMPFCNAIAGWITERPFTGTAADAKRWNLERGTFQGTLISIVDGTSEIPFECTYSSGGSNNTTGSDQASVSTWRFELPNAQGILTIKARWEDSKLERWKMDCDWKRSAAAVLTTQSSEGDQGRSISIQVVQDESDRTLRVSAPWNSAIRSEHRFVSTSEPPSVRGALVFQSRVGVQRQSTPGDRYVAKESVLVEPKSLFEIEQSLGAKKEQWMRGESTRLKAMLIECLAVQSNREKVKWEAGVLQSFDKMRSIEQQLALWRGSWDQIVGLPQFRVGSKFTGHPDR
ncbi:MAG: hypothetical protein RJB11_471 [Planctomycetota bacterium]